MSISQNRTLSVCTEISTYAVAAGQQQVVLEMLLAEIKRWVSQQPGFLTASGYPSADGTRVLSHVEWWTQQDWQNARQNSAWQVSHSRLIAIPGTTLVDTNVYTTPKIMQGSMEGVFALPWKDEKIISHAGAPGESATVLLHGTQTSNTISIVGATSAPNAGPPLHYHTLEDEIWHVIDGEYEFQVDQKIIRAGAGTTVFGPRNHPHNFRFIGENGVGHILLMFTPAGFEGIFLELNKWASAGKQPTREELVTQADHYGIHFARP